MRLLRNPLMRFYTGFLLFTVFTCCITYGDSNSGNTYVFFVQNTYQGLKDKDNSDLDLSENTTYVNLVDNLYEVFLNYINCSKGKDEREKVVCQKVTDYKSDNKKAVCAKTKTDLLKTFKSFIDKKFKRNDLLFIVLNGHGKQDRDTHMYKFIAGDRDPVYLFEFAEKLNCDYFDRDGGEKNLPTIIFLVLTCREDSDSDLHKITINEKAKWPIRRVIIYGCSQGGKIGIEKQTENQEKEPGIVIKCLLEALSGAADAEYDSFERSGFHNGEISLLELWRYLDWRIKKSDYKISVIEESYPECVSQCRDKDGSIENRNMVWSGVVSKVDKAFLKPSNFKTTIGYEQLFASGNNNNYYNSQYIIDEYPRLLPEKYQYKFTNNEFSYADYHDCIFENIDFSYSQFKISGSLRGTKFINCNLEGATIDGEYLNNNSTATKEGYQIEYRSN